MSRAGAKETPYSVTGYLDVVAGTLEATLGRADKKWIRAEISKKFERDHLYLDVVDADRGAQLKAKCWKGTWQPLKARLESAGVSLAEGSVITFEAYVDIYKVRGELGVVISDIDVSSALGDAELRRQELIARLSAEGVIVAKAPDHDSHQFLPELPLRVGLVASPGTEGYNDFLGQLTNSPYCFDVRVARATVQGDSAPAEVVSALGNLVTGDDAWRPDIVCIVRGGGSKLDLSCFDDERIARAIAASPIPVATGIGHTGDISIADMATLRNFITPTATGAALVRAVDAWREKRVLAPARHLALVGRAVVEEADHYLARTRRELVRGSLQALGNEAAHLQRAREQLHAGSARAVSEAVTYLQSTRRFLGAHDPTRRLAQGWTLVSRDGQVLTSSREIHVGDLLDVTFADGIVSVRVEERK
jgi:exodeoxyribonuclease VII large subunit